jgi:hypothetical protein
MENVFEVPLIIRGEVIEDFSVEYGGRQEGSRFRSAQAVNYIDKIVSNRPSDMADLYSISIEEIVDYLCRLGRRLTFSENKYMQEAFELSKNTSGLSESILHSLYETIPGSFTREGLIRSVDKTVGIDFLEGWVPLREGVRVRAFGARALHVIAGNAPLIGVASVIRNALTRSDAIIKAPSNDPLTTTAVARTMVEMDPDHPVTKHLTVAYWKGGDEAFEEQLCQPRNIEKIIAWGGFNSIKHISGYLQPGIDLITLDPKQSGTIIGEEAFSDTETMKSVAERAALDVGGFNQEGCLNARVIYLTCGTDDEGIEKAKDFGKMLFDAIQELPDTISTPHRSFDPDLKQEIDALRFVEDEYTVIGGKGSEGAVIVSHESEQVDFARQLSCRVANVVPIDSVETAIKSVNAYTQTIGIFPESLKIKIRDRLAYQGGQRLVSLGGAISPPADAPQDGLEIMRRMCKWIVDDTQ